MIFRNCKLQLEIMAVYLIFFILQQFSTFNVAFE